MDLNNPHMYPLGYPPIDILNPTVIRQYMVFDPIVKNHCYSLSRISSIHSLIVARSYGERADNLE